MTLLDLIDVLGEEIQDPDEETFLLFSAATFSQNLGFIDPKADALQITVADREMTIEQSPSLLSSDRKGGTTGAVVWKITPIFARWIVSHDNVLFKTSVINSDSIVLELGCGISGIVALSMSPKVKTFIATDQDYVFKKLRLNLRENTTNIQKSKSTANAGPKNTRGSLSTAGNIKVVGLDWELSLPLSLLDLILPERSNVQENITAIVACDCIFNEALIDPFVQTCADICHLSNGKQPHQPTLCIIAQQLRSHTVFEAWISAFLRKFRIWRIPDGLLNEDLAGCSGFVIHIAILRKLPR